MSGPVNIRVAADTPCAGGICKKTSLEISDLATLFTIFGSAVWWEYTHLQSDYASTQHVILVAAAAFQCYIGAWAVERIHLHKLKSITGWYKYAEIVLRFIVFAIVGAGIVSLGLDDKLTLGTIVAFYVTLLLWDFCIRLGGCKALFFFVYFDIAGMSLSIALLLFTQWSPIVSLLLACAIAVQSALSVIALKGMQDENKGLFGAIPNDSKTT